MSDLALRVDHLSKAYRIAHAQDGQKIGRYKTLQEDLLDLPRGLWSAVRGRNNAGHETVWALKEVSFEVKQGEVVGIIGRNGAGKSTLLKILSRITEPTEGRAEVYGRVGSLMEVGTGFHPELTGRENIFLNGAVLGMRRGEIARKFDEIVAFAEVEKFIDTPVKFYSSGMYVRLAFAVAAHLQPEILVVDEVLAVGDLRFQEKCLGKMSQISGEGRTVLFVSHNMAAVQHLCSSGVVLEAGKISYIGPVHQAIALYAENTARVIQGIGLRDRRDRKGDQSLRFTEVRILDKNGNICQRVLSGQDIMLRFYYESSRTFGEAAVNINFNVYNSQMILLANLNSKDVGRLYMPVNRLGYFECTWPEFNLRSGVYTCSLFCEIDGSISDWMQSAFEIHVEDGDFYGTGSLLTRGWGDVLINYDWESKTQSETTLV